MRSMSAKEAKDNFGRLIDTARAAPVVIEKAWAARGGRYISGGIRTAESH